MRGLVFFRYAERLLSFPRAALDCENENTVDSTCHTTRNPPL
jgi:hypothetical protein